MDISADDVHDMRRDDLQVAYTNTSSVDLLRKVSEVCFMPLGVGGRIRTLDQIQDRLSAGADKCIINTEAFRRPEFLSEASRRFGAQCIVVSIDAKRHPDGSLEVYVDSGREPTGLEPAVWAKRVQDLGAGEIFLNSIDRDGAGVGYDLDLIRSVTEAVDVPVIACGGVGAYDHFPAAIQQGGATAAAAANIFNFYELSYPHAKKACLEAGVPMRDVKLDSKWFPREPEYDHEAETTRLERRLEMARKKDFAAAKPAPTSDVRWCAKCVYPSINAAPMEFDDQGVCMGCRMREQTREIPEEIWKKREQKLVEILEENRSKDGSRPDCVIAVSGGKDSYYQTHYIKEVLGFNPLLVTYYGNNYTTAGQRNLDRMKDAFGVDHIIYYPSVPLLKKLNRLGFEIMGDTCWHSHLGINTLPMKIAALHKIPIVIWGEVGYIDLCGQFSVNDFVEFTYRNRLEHPGRGFEWNYFVGREGITKSDMYAFQYPTDQEVFDINLRGIYIGNYIHWDANEHTQLMIDRYGFEQADEPFDRTYRMMSSLDNMHENGVHDYLKYLKLGYGRCTDHCTKDIRDGYMSRGQALDLVRKYDPVKPRDLYRWLEYVDMSEEEFDAIADTFRDPRVWYMKDGQWTKKNIWD